MSEGNRILKWMWISIDSLLAALLLFPLMSLYLGANGFIAAYVIIMLGRGALIVIMSVRMHAGLLVTQRKVT